MKRKHTHILVYLPVWLTLLSLLPACNKKLDLPDVGGEKSISLLGELVANDSFNFRAGQSVPMVAGENLKFDVLHGLTAYIVDGQNNISLEGKEDSATQSLHTIPFTSSQKVLPNHSYSIVASHAQLGIATATIDVPGAFTAQVVDTVSTNYSTEYVLKVSFKIDDPGNTTNYYVVEALKQKGVVVESEFLYNGQWLNIQDNLDLYYELLSQGTFPQTKTDTMYYNSYVRRVLYTDDVYTDNVTENGKFHRNRRVFLKDKNFNGTSYTSHVYIPVDTLSYSLFESGTVQLLIKSVPENYYRFLKAYESFSDAGGYSTFSQPVKISGNVNNGVGMIGAAYLVRIPLYFDYNY